MFEFLVMHLSDRIKGQDTAMRACVPPKEMLAVTSTLTYFVLFISIHLVKITFQKCADFPPCFRLLNFIFITITGFIP